MRHRFRSRGGRGSVSIQNNHDAAKAAARLKRAAQNALRTLQGSRVLMEMLEDRVLLSSTPYLGTPAAVPGTVQAENYDLGGEGVAYHDTTTANLGGKYRTSEGVDIQSTTDAGGGYDVGWTAAGEWMNYTVDVATGGFYDITFRVAPGGGAAGGTFHLADAAGDNLTGELSIPATGGTQTFTNVAAERISLSAGTQILTIDMDTAGSGGYIGNFNYFTLATSAAPAAPTSVTAVGSNLGTITLAWTAPASPVDSYDVYRSTTPGGEGGTPIATGITATSYTDSTVSSRVTYYYTVTAIDQTGQSTASSEVSAQATRDGNPYGGTAPSVSLTGTTAIQSEDYNTGGQNIAYYDTGSAPETQTTTDTGGGSIVAFVYASEWLKYTINVTTTGAYSLDFRVASNGLGGTFHVEDELGNNLTGSLTVPNTNGWQTLTNLLTPSFNLSAGTHVLKVVMDTNGPGGNVGNFNYFAIGAGAAPGTVTNVAAHAVSETTVLLSWSASPGASDYLVQRSIDGGDFETIATVAAAALTAYEDSSLSAGQSAQYNVVAANLSGDSSASTGATATTASAGSDQLWQVTLSSGSKGSTGATDTGPGGSSPANALTVSTPVVEADSAVDAVALAVDGQVYTDTTDAFDASSSFSFSIDPGATSASALAAAGVAFVVRNDQTANGVLYNPLTMGNLNYNAATGVSTGWIGLEDLTKLGTSSSNDKDYNDWYWAVSVQKAVQGNTFTVPPDHAPTGTLLYPVYPLGTIYDPYANGNANALSSTIVNWGDGTSTTVNNPQNGSSVTISYVAGNEFDVTGIHAFPNKWSPNKNIVLPYKITIQVTFPGNLEATATSTANLAVFHTLSMFQPATGIGATSTVPNPNVSTTFLQGKQILAGVQDLLPTGTNPDWVTYDILDNRTRAVVWSSSGNANGNVNANVGPPPGDIDFTFEAFFRGDQNEKVDLVTIHFLWMPQFWIPPQLPILGAPIGGVYSGGGSGGGGIHSPQITSVGPSLGYVGQFVTYAVVSTDPNMDVLTYSLAGAPDGMSINSGTGLVTWTPTSSELGGHDVTVTVTDALGHSGTQDWHIGVVAQSTAPPPSNFSAIALSTQQIYLSWDAVSGADGYVIQRTDADGSSPVILGGSTPVDSSLFYADQDLPSGTTYEYSIMTVMPDGTYSAPSAPVAATTWALPAEPTGLTATAIDGNDIYLSWDDGRPADSHITGWQIFRSTSPDGPFTPLIGSDEILDAPMYTDDTATPGTTYWYEVVAVDHLTELSAPAEVSVTTPTYGSGDSSGSGNGGESGTSGSGSGGSGGSGGSSLPGTLGIPAAPTDLTAAYTGDEPQRSVNLSWNYPALSGTGFDGFNIYRGTQADFTPSAATFIGTEGSGNYYTDTGVNQLPPGTYYYRVIAVLDDGSGDETYSLVSNVAEANTGVEPAAPTAPSNLAINNLTPDSLTLTWQNNSLADTQLDIYRRVDNGGDPGEWDIIGTAGPTDASFVDTTIQPSTTYDYFVAAINEAVSSSAPGDDHSSAIATTTTLPPGTAPDSPTLSVTGQSDTSISLSWTPNSDGVGPSGYYLYRSPAGANQFVRIGELDASILTYVDSGLQPGTSWDYELTAVSSDDTQSAPATASAATTTDSGTAPVVYIATPASYVGGSVVGNSSSGGGGGNLDDPGDGGSGGGSTFLTLQNNQITQATTVTGIIDDLSNDLASWTLTLQPLNVVGGGATQPLLVSSSAMTGNLYVGSAASGANGAIGLLDPSLYPSGNYNLVLTATSSDNQTSTTSITVSLASKVSLGNLDLPFTDLTVNVPGGQPITVTRVYNSQDAATSGDFGYGWSLELNTATIRTTAEAPVDYDADGATDFRAGDLVYITLPNGEQHVFEFLPIPDSFSSTDQNPYDTGTYQNWTPQFVCVDGSGATLSVEGDVHSDPADQISLGYDPATQEFYTNDSEYGEVGYDPAAPMFGNQYTLTTSDGTSYAITASSGQIESITDANGNVTNYSDGSALSGITINRDAANGNRIDWIAIGNDYTGNPSTPGFDGVVYTYDSSGNLIQVTNVDGSTTGFSYDSNHYLTQVIDGRGIPTLNATYDSLGQLTSLTDADGNASSVGTSGFDGSRASQSVTTPQDNTTEDIYDAYGNVTRSITAITDADGDITGYSVSVTQYGYDNSLDSNPGPAFANDPSG